mmetsp:Transcript_26340/g.60678  ORF Transcript_26340/g.60678 Transcript_26340/m.60678 type:complete len:272 (+) Transcript_26340:437-1252(+)
MLGCRGSMFLMSSPPLPSSIVFLSICLCHFFRSLGFQNVDYVPLPVKEKSSLHASPTRMHMTDPGNNDGEGSNNIFQESGIWKRRDIFATSALLLPLASLPFFSSFFPFAVELGGGKWKREPAAARDGPVNLALTSSMKQSTESVLLSLLPLSLSTGGGSVRAFLTLRDRVEGVGVVRLLGYTDKAWSDALRFSSDALEFLDAKRDYLTPLFREDDDAMTQIYKETRAEDRIEAVRVGITDLIDAVADKDVRRTYEVQRRVLLALSDVGEL